MNLRYKTILKFKSKIFTKNLVKLEDFIGYKIKICKKKKVIRKKLKIFNWFKFDVLVSKKFIIRRRLEV